MSDASPAPSFSLTRVLLLAVPIMLLAYGAKMYSGSLEQAARTEAETNTAKQLLGAQDYSAKLADGFADADGDLVADAPTDAAKLADPKEIRFSYVATTDPSSDETTWKEFLDALSKRLERPVKLVSFADAEEQKRALKAGELDVAAFGTGDVPSAVNEVGFAPVACLANKEGKYSYTMKVIVPADSEIKKIEDLKGRRMTFVRPGSNSGFTVPLVLLMDKYDLQPDRDYRWGFSYGHESSIDGVAAKKFEAAAVASDILDRRIASGEIEADAVRTIYESEPFPGGVIGVVYNLKPELAEGIRKTLLEFDFAGTGLEKSFGGSGAAKFAAVSYKTDWAPVREISETSAAMHADLQTAAR